MLVPIFAKLLLRSQHVQGISQRIIKLSPVAENADKSALSMNSL